MTKFLFFLGLMSLSWPVFGQASPDYSVLTGTWEVDFTPSDPNDDIGTQMVIKSASAKKLKGTFYGSSFKENQVTFELETIHFAFLTSDASGDYHTSGRLVDGQIKGTTHSLARDFLTVWVAEKVDD